MSSMSSIGSDKSKDDDEWQQLYEIKDLEVNDLKGKFYMTYGGGPEGGYFVRGNRLYNITRTWGQPWGLERIFGMMLIVNTDGDSVNFVSDDEHGSGKDNKGKGTDSDIGKGSDIGKP